MILLHPLGAARKLRQQRGRPGRPGHQIAAAVGTAAFEPGLGALGAEGAFEGADARVAAVGREIAIAAFAIGTKQEHKTLR